MYINLQVVCKKSIVCTTRDEKMSQVLLRCKCEQPDLVSERIQIRYAHPHREGVIANGNAVCAKNTLSDADTQV